MFFADNYPIDLPKLLETKLLLQAQSGGGKSHALRRLLEQTAPHVQQLVIDTEGEFATLREKFEYIIAAPHGADAVATPDTAALLAKRLHESGVSAILDIYDLKAADRQLFVKRFLDALMTIPRAQWHPVLLVIDEIQVYCPQTGLTDASAAVIDIATRGRKRGLCLVGAMLRLSKLHKDCAAELQNKLIGRTGLDIDVKRAADELGFLPREARVALRGLDTGEFYAYGPALSKTVERIKVGPVVTTHAKSGEGLMKAPPPASKKVLEQLAKLADIQKQAIEEVNEMASLRERVKTLTIELDRAKRAAPTSSNQVDDLRKLHEKAVDDLDKLRKGHAFEITKIRMQFADAIQTFSNHLETEIKNLTARSCIAIDKGAPGGDKTVTEKISLAGITDQKPALKISEDQLRQAFKIPPKPQITVSNETEETQLSKPQQRILNALAHLEMLRATPADKRTVAALAGVKHSSGSFGNNLGRLRTLGFIDYPSSGKIDLTKLGLSFANECGSPLTLEHIHAQWFSIMSGPQCKLLQELIRTYPQSIAKSVLADLVGVQASSGSYGNNLGAMRTMGAIDYPSKGMVRASDLLFPAGVK